MRLVLFLVISRCSFAGSEPMYTRSISRKINSTLWVYGVVLPDSLNARRYRVLLFLKKNPVTCVTNRDVNIQDGVHG